MRHRLSAAAAACLFLLSCGAKAMFAQETVTVSIPHAIRYQVTNVSVVTTANAGTVTLSFQNAKLSAGKVLRISVRAKAANLAARSRSPIPSSKVSWTAGSASGGTGFS